MSWTKKRMQKPTSWSQPLRLNLQIAPLVEVNSIAPLVLKFRLDYVFKAEFRNIQHCATFFFVHVKDSSSCFSESLNSIAAAILSLISGTGLLS